MKAVILAGGKGSRISEESQIKPKPLIELGGKPIIWHIMKHYAHYGVTEFVILLGYKGHMIKQYFMNYYLHHTDVRIDLKSNSIETLNNVTEPWKITLLDTGLETMTGGRIKRAEQYLKDAPFFLTYGDGVSNINIDELLSFHKKSGKTLTLTAIHRPEKFGILDIDSKSTVKTFLEKPKVDAGFINGGFFVCEPSLFKFIENNDNAIFERDTLQPLAEKKELAAYKFNGFWKCMDTLRDKLDLEDLINQGAPWQVWKKR